MSDNLSFEQMAYELPEIWEEEYFTSEDFKRVKELGKKIISDADTLLDVGCGNGIFLNHLAAAYPARFTRIVGVDRSKAALSHVKTEKMIATVDNLPFADKEFHTVTSMEVLEHLPVTIYPKAIS